jgi:hypothetical protein
VKVIKVESCRCCPNAEYEEDDVLCSGIFKAEYREI